MKRLIVSAILTYTSALVNAQDPAPFKIKLDFSTKQFDESISKIDTLKKGQWYQVEISNINLNLYKVSLSSSDTTLSSPQKTPTFGSIGSGLDDLSKLISGITSFSTIVPSYAKLDSAVSAARSEALFAEEIRSRHHEITQRMADEKKRLENFKGRLDAVISAIDQEKLNVYKARLNALRESQPAPAFNFDAALTSMERIRASLSILKNDVAPAKSGYEDYYKQHKPAIDGKVELKENDKTIKTAYEKLLTSLQEAQTAVSADKVNELLSSVVHLVHNSGSYTSVPVRFMGEQGKVTIAISPREESYNLQSYTSKLVFPVYQKTYTAVGLSYFASSLYDSAYSAIRTKVAGSDSTWEYSYHAEDVTKAEMGLAALLRYGCKLTDDYRFGFHGSIGAGVTLSNRIRPRFMGGVGFSFGLKHMLAVDLGGIAGYVDRKSAILDPSEKYPAKAESVVISKLKFGGFLSAGYIYQF